jgi:hypothetical protein
MRSLCIAAVCLSAPLFAAQAQTDRVGTFDKQSIVIAFYRSPMWAATMKEHVAARDSAKRSGDTTRVRELEAWGAGHQELAHQQLAGNAPLTNIVDALQPALDSIRQVEHLRAIVPAPVADARVAVIDVTPQLLDWLKADAKTREIIGQMPRAPY